MRLRAAAPRSNHPYEPGFNGATFRFRSKLLAKSLFSIVFALGLLLIVQPLVAQTNLSSLNGVAVDQQGRPIAGATVTILNVQTGISMVATTDESGQYHAVGLQPGTYSITAAKPTFATVKHVVTLSIGQNLVLNITLPIPQEQQTVIVAAEEPLINVASTSVTTVIENKEIESLPLNGRQFVDYALLTPGVSSGQAVSVGGEGQIFEQVPKLSVNGLGEQSANNFALDGANFTNFVSGLQHSSPSQDAVAEFRVIQNSYEAEYGNYIGGYLNINTKSGTNNQHGALYEYLMNNKLNANNYLSAPGLTVFRQNQFGASTGGAIQKDKLFYFLSYEGQRQANSPIYPTYVLQNLDLINRVKLYYHLPPEKLNILQTADYDTGVGRIDYHVSTNNQLMVRYFGRNEQSTNVPGSAAGTGTPSSFRNFPVMDQSVVAHLFTTATSHLANDILVQYSRRTANYSSLNGQPNLEIADVMDTGKNLGGVDFYREQRGELRDNVSYFRGNHSLKAGVAYNRIQDNFVLAYASAGWIIFTPQSFAGTFPFDGTVPGSAPGTPFPVAMFVNMPNSTNNQLVTRTTDWTQLYTSVTPKSYFTPHPMKTNVLEFYAQDNWKVSNSFTLDYGINYLYEGVDPLIDIKADRNNIAPRVGFAYNYLDGKAVLRGGIGLFYSQRAAPALWTNLEQSNGSSDRLRNLDPSLPPSTINQFRRPDTSIGRLAGPIPGTPAEAQAVYNFIVNGIYPTTEPLVQGILNQTMRYMPNPYALHWSLENQLTFGRDWTLTLSYVGERAAGINGLSSMPYSLKKIGLTADGRNLYGPSNPNYAFYFYTFPGNWSHYESGTVTLMKRFSHFYMVNATYTYSRTLDAMNAGTQSIADIPEDPFNYAQEKAVSNESVPHNFILMATAEAPEGSFLRNFAISTATTLQSGRFSSIFAGSDVQGDGIPQNDRVGHVGRNTYRGDHLYQVDLRITRDFSLTKKISGQFVAEGFNLINRPNVYVVNTVYGAPDFIGPVPTHYGQNVTAPLSSFGRPSVTGPGRQFQFALKFKW